MYIQEKRCMYACSRKEASWEDQPLFMITDISYQLTSHDFIAQPTWGLIADMRHNATTLRLDHASEVVQSFFRRTAVILGSSARPSQVLRSLWIFLSYLDDCSFMSSLSDDYSFVSSLSNNCSFISSLSNDCSFISSLSRSVSRYRPFFDFIEMRKDRFSLCVWPFSAGAGESVASF